ncbi:MAG: Uma2 family endonuclease [Hyphomicrobiaceae bacterium]|nr:Uma2 family endonuclease [Hyphomicrobiaceae bacterium]
MGSVAKRYDSGLPTGLDVDAFLAWVNNRPGRYELHDGAVFAMAPERLWHARMKYKVQRALDEGIEKAGLEGRMVPDGVAVHVSTSKWYEPDAMVYCGPEAPSDNLNILDPIILVEVASPSTERLDETFKLTGYFSVPSVQHYLIIYPEGPLVHHQRQGDGTLLTRLVSSGPIRLDPPGIALDTSLFIA